MKRSGLDYILEGACLADCRFGSFSKFAKFLKEDFSEICTQKEASKKLRKFIKTLKKDYSVIGQKEAKNLLLAEDLESIGNIISKVCLPDPFETLNQMYIKAKKFFTKHGLLSKFPNYYIVESFPEPFQNMAWDCMFLDEADEEKFNVRAGIYFKKALVKNYITPLLLFHELVHMAISEHTGEKEKGIGARGLEEGICDLFGMYLFSKSEGVKVTKNVMIFFRFNYDNKPLLTPLYRDALRVALVLYKNLGIQGLMNLIKSGRGSIMEVEKSCLNGKFDLKGIKKGWWEEKFDILVNSLLSYRMYWTVSPLAYYVVRASKQEQDIESLIRNYNLHPVQTRKALKELQENYFFGTFHKNLFIYNIYPKDYIKNGYIRYKN